MMYLLQVADSCVTAAVLLANILTDAADLALEIFQGEMIYC